MNRIGFSQETQFRGKAFLLTSDLKFLKESYSFRTRTIGLALFNNKTVQEISLRDFGISKYGKAFAINTEVSYSAKYLFYLSHWIRLNIGGLILLNTSYSKANFSNFNIKLFYYPVSGIQWDLGERFYLDLTIPLFAEISESYTYRRKSGKEKISSWDYDVGLYKDLPVFITIAYKFL